ncbi:MAG: long-chain fatty acid--CoA ligase [Leptolyngbya sp. PLA3]|nr:MAG: long-chain fatty acid--CoA ligase [Cyanobacteria bacterium CYA]MCE7969063.1 long-chain fatty acid--CoA ligase [Leptolyngbya sp. PL-A3]
MSVHWPIIRRLALSPSGVAVIDDHRSYRGAEILVAAANLADAIEAKSGTQNVGIMLPTSGAFPIAALACWMLGRTVVPLNYLLSRDELTYVVNDCETDTIVSAQPMIDFVGFEPSVKNLLRLERTALRRVPSPRWPRRGEPDDLAVILYTSGTSGRPKGVMLTHRNLHSNVRQVEEWVHFKPTDVFCGVLPQFHSFGLTVLTLLPLSFGLKVVYTARFVPNRIVQLLREHRPAMFVAIPSMYNALLQVKNAEPADFASIRFAVSGGEPLPTDVARRFHDRFGVTIAEGYGLTETAPVTNWCRPQDYRPHSVGMPLPGVIERVVDPVTETELPPGYDGELRIAGPNVMRGYFKLPRQTRDAFDRLGYLRTGDMARFDDDGHLYITGRIKEMLIVGGENVFPREIEEVLNQHPSVRDSAVIGQPDPMRGEVPIAFVELEDGASLDEKSILSLCRDKLAGYKVPKCVIPLEALPRNATGKIMRRQLKAPSASADV